MNTFALKEPYTIPDVYDQAEVARSVFAITSVEGQEPVRVTFGGVLRPFRIDDGGKRIYAPIDRTIPVQIDDLSKPLTDPLLEDLRQKVVQAYGVIVMGLNVVKGKPLA